MKNGSIRLSKALHITAALALMGALWMAAPAAHAAIAQTIWVDTTELLLTNNSNCDFREALLAASSNAVVDTCEAGDDELPDIIAFNIGASGSSHTIMPTFTIDVDSPVYIDGTSQPGWAGTPLIKFATTDWTPILRFNTAAAGSTLRGLQFSTTSGLSYLVYIFASNVTVIGNYFGTDGTSVLGPDSDGVVLDGSSNSHIGGAEPAKRNFFGGEHGVTIEGGGGNTVQGNYFGVTSSGNALLAGTPAYPMHGVGVGHNQDTSNNTIRGNLISGGYHWGIYLEHHASGNLIAGNMLGLDATGVTRLGNIWGIGIQGASNNTIGGTTADDRNVISGSLYNIIIQDFSNTGIHVASNNQISGNFIGTTADGMSRVTPFATEGIDEIGIYLQGGDLTTIGGATAAHGNVIGGNDSGIEVLSGATGTKILNNKIGTNADGTAALRQELGIRVDTPAAMIGDDATPGNNLISGNDTGINFMGSATGTVYNNRIGLTALGGSALPNGYGIIVGGSSGATVAENWIAYSTHYGLSVGGTATIAAGSTDNCFTSNTSYGAFTYIPSTPSLINNWWGSETGPTHWSNSGGTGDAVNDGVAYSPFLTLPAAACHIFADVPVAGKEWMEPWVDSFYLHGITTGCGASPLIYCPENPVTRAAMAVFILRTIEGPTYTPPAATHTFSDLPVAGKEWMEPWVDEFYDRGITTGCGTDPLRYCPENPVTRAAMAVFLLRAIEGSTYVPDHTHGYFDDLPVAGKEWMEPFVDEFYDRGITTGCGASPLRYCPENPVTRAAMAVFISRAYGLYP